MLRGDPGQVLSADVEPGQQGQRNDAPGRVPDEQPEDDEDVAVNVGRAGRSGGWVVVDAGPLDVRPVPPRRRVVQGDGQPLGVAEQRLDRRQQQVGGDGPGLLAGGRNGRVAGPVLIAEAGGADPAGDGPAAAGQEGAKEQEDESGRGPPVEYGSDSGEPLARGGQRR